MSVRKLKNLRGQIDRIDRRLLDLLNERSKVALQVGKIKREARKDVYAPVREKELLDGLVRRNRGPFPNHAVRAVFREVVSASRALQSPLKASYFGPEGSFTNLAALKYFGRSTDLVPEPSISKVFGAVEQDRADFGVVPIENSTEGIVGPTLDQFIDSTLNILGEITLPVAHHLLSREGSLKGIRRIYSHPQAIAQCRNWLEQNVPGIPAIEAENTARAAEKAAEDAGSAAIAGEYAGEVYGLKVVKRHIEDNPNNMTRFWVIGKKFPPKSGNDKTSILFSVKDEVGILYRMLEPFWKNRINLTKIESRPLKKKAWEYIFFLDMDGHYDEKRVKDAIQGLDRRCLFLKLLGSYPKANH
ncbi:MAG TPA: prephenate dehydratase [bacterium]|nr:prephenate dehydratase [bacterium]